MSNNVKKNFVFLVIFDTCDVVYNRSISLLPLIVLDNLFDLALKSSYLQSLPLWITLYIDLQGLVRLYMRTEEILYL